MKVSSVEIPGLLIFEPRVFRDNRGCFFESFNTARYREAGLGHAFVQDNVSLSHKGVLRGLHGQNPHPQGKLVYCLDGEVWDVAVDIRSGSPTFGRWYGLTLSSANRRQLWIPPGFAHGFFVVSDSALFAYKVTDYYCGEGDFSIRWDDPEIGIRWPLNGMQPTISSKDQAGVGLAVFPHERLVPFEGA